MRSRIGSAKQALQLDFKDPSGMLQASVGCKTKGCPQSDISRGHYHGALPPSACTDGRAFDSSRRHGHIDGHWAGR